MEYIYILQGPFSAAYMYMIHDFRGDDLILDI